MVNRHSPKQEVELSEAEVWSLLESIKDPEIPVVSVVELGLIRSVDLSGSKIRIGFTPTFSGCPALEMMRQQIRSCLMEAGAAEVEVVLLTSPRWSTDDLLPSARQKLKEFGIAPPPTAGGDLEIALQTVVRCPYCGSENTSLRNSFGPTLCRAIYTCNHCRQPFEQFKPL